MSFLSRTIPMRSLKYKYCALLYTTLSPTASHEERFLRQIPSVVSRHMWFVQSKLTCFIQIKI